MVRKPEQSDKDLRAFIRTTTSGLGELRLKEAVTCFATYFLDMRGYVEGEGRDGVVFYEDVTNSGTGTRLELGMCRLFRLPCDEADLYRPAYRLRLSLHYKWDMDVIRFVLPDGSWSLHCWSPDEVAALLEAVRGTSAYKTMESKSPAAVKIKLEHTTYKASALNPPAGAKQNWWGVWDIA